MIDHLRFVAQRLEAVVLEDRPPVRPESWGVHDRGEILHATGREVVDDRHLFALAHERFGEVRADEPRAARDEHFHSLTPGRPLKKAHLRRWLGRSSLRRTTTYVSVVAPSPPRICTFGSALRSFSAGALGPGYAHVTSLKGLSVCTSSAAVLSPSAKLRTQKRVVPGIASHA